MTLIKTVKILIKSIRYNIYKVKRPVINWFKAPEVELIYRSKVRASQRPVIMESKSAYNFLLANWDLDKIELVEEFIVVYLNQASKVLGIYRLSQGGMSCTIVDVRLVFIAGLKYGASQIIISHSHPSGNIRPSRSDEELTKKIKEAGDFLNIKVVDHIIITLESYFSFSDQGLL